MNTYEFEYDTLNSMNLKVSYQTNTLVEAVKKLKRNTRVQQILMIKENGMHLGGVLKGIYLKGI